MKYLDSQVVLKDIVMYINRPIGLGVDHRNRPPWLQLCGLKKTFKMA